MQAQGTPDPQETIRLLRSVAEQLKSPLTAIARQAELGQITGDPALVDLTAVSTQATAAMTLVDCYLLGLKFLGSQETLELEPVSVSSLLVDVAHELDAFAGQYDTRLELHIGGKYEPVMAHRGGLRAALLALGYGLLGGYPQPGRRLTLAVHRTPHGIVTGLYGNYEQLSASQWRRALDLRDRAGRPFGALSSGSSAGLFVAETILQTMETRLRVGRHCKKQGLATTLQPSQQLRFV